MTPDDDWSPAGALLLGAGISLGLIGTALVLGRVSKTDKEAPDSLLYRPRFSGMASGKIDEREARETVARLASEANDTMDRIRRDFGGENDFMDRTYDPTWRDIDALLDKAYALVGSVSTKNQKAIDAAMSALQRARELNASLNLS